LPWRRPCRSSEPATWRPSTQGDRRLQYSSRWPRDHHGILRRHWSAQRPCLAWSTSSFTTTRTTGSTRF
jgi:hypothetical protein